MNDVGLFKVEINYFKPSGKWKYEATVEREFRTCGNDGELCYMADVCDWFRGLLGKEELPGLSCKDWDGFVVLDCPEHGYPCLIVPGWVDAERKRLGK